MGRGIRREWVAMVATVAMAGPAPAGACTVCDGANGREVRRGLTDGDAALHLLATTLPFAAVGAVVAVVHFGVPFNWKGRRDGNVRR